MAPPHANKPDLNMAAPAGGLTRTAARDAIEQELKIRCAFVAFPRAFWRQL
jgi:hypothetical protein